MSVLGLNAQDFQVGWICVVEVEYVIACELLDEEYSSTPATSANDDNIYTYGRIGQYHVVLACLPKGKYGLTSAASVAKDMLRSFPAIRVGLMVGIGGGAPSTQHDIRMGDVVVSTPVGRTGGVIHYEMGKTIQSKRLERTGSLDAPPVALLNAIQKLSSNHKRKGHHIAQTIGGAIQKNGRLRKVYTKPDPSSDVLFQSSFVHADSKLKCTDLCCPQQHQVLTRADRDAADDDPTIHYGLIASADRLMKDAETRDQLAAAEGVLCFEMEAAGLMDRFRCVVIRGICDYSDTHKNDIWQGYAAATAAAYAKELLEVIPCEAVHQSATLFQAQGASNESSKDPRHSSKPVGDEGQLRHQAEELISPTPQQTNHFSGTFTSGRNMYAGGTFNSDGGSMNL